LIISAGTTLTSEKNVYIDDGGNLQVNGTLVLKQNLMNQNLLQDNLGTGTVQFTGNVLQLIDGENIMQNVVMNNSSMGLLLFGNTRINGILTMTNGRITLGAYHLHLGPYATVSGSPSVSSMVIPSGTGELRKEFSSGSAFAFPIGDVDGTHEYSPITINFISTAFPAGNYVGVNVNNSKYADPGITGNYLNRYWKIRHSGFSDVTCNLTFQYTAADVVGYEAALSCTKVFGLPSTTYSPANTSLHQLNATNISWFGTFTGVKSTTTPANQQLANISIPSGMTRCYDATEVLTVGGSGYNFNVASGGSVTLVAGQKISMLPGVSVALGGYLHGYISTDGTYCGSMMNPLVSNPTKEIEVLSEIMPANDQFIKIYPNPTADIVIVEFLNYDPGSPLNIEIYNMNGQLIISKSLTGITKQQFSLAGLPVGIYMVHARSDSRSEIAKIVKKTE
jgi:hypothetical protein